MKKLSLTIVLMLAAMVAAAQEHIEFKWYGLYNVIDFSYGKNVNSKYDDVSMTQFTAVMGFQYRKETGVGLGVCFMSDGSNGYTQLPLFVELRSHYLRSRLTPYTVVRAGYTLPLGESSGGTNAVTIKKGGAYFGLEVGGRFAVSPKFGVSAHLRFSLLNMNEVEFCDKLGLAERHGVLFHVIGGGAGINF